MPFLVWKGINVTIFKTSVGIMDMKTLWRFAFRFGLLSLPKFLNVFKAGSRVFFTWAFEGDQMEPTTRTSRFGEAIKAAGPANMVPQLQEFSLWTFLHKLCSKTCLYFLIYYIYTYIRNSIDSCPSCDLVLWSSFCLGFDTLGGALSMCFLDLLLFLVTRHCNTQLLAPSHYKAAFLCHEGVG